jgi:tripartite-type tricarboxylate transporter receptor subunit TctC
MSHLQPAAVPQGRRRLLATLASLGAAVASSLPAPALGSDLTWPRHRIRLITPAAPGSSLDLDARILAEGLAARWDRPVVVDSHPGAEGIPALRAMLGAPPGEALLAANHGVVTVVPVLHPELGFDPMDAFSPLLDLTSDLFGLSVPAALPARDLAGLIAEARAQPGALNYTTAPGPPYLAMRAFLRDAGAEMTFVGYRGVGAAIVGELLAGRLQVMLSPLAPVLAAAREGRLRVLAVTGSERAPALPSVPTSAEQGFSGFRQEGIHGLFGWQAMLPALRTRVAAEATAVMNKAEVAERIRQAGRLVRQGGTPEGFATMLAEQRRRWAALAQEFGPEPPS